MWPVSRPTNYSLPFVRHASDSQLLQVLVQQCQSDYDIHSEDRKKLLQKVLHFEVSLLVSGLLMQFYLAAISTFITSHMPLFSDGGHFLKCVEWAEAHKVFQCPSHSIVRISHVTQSCTPSLIMKFGQYIARYSSRYSSPTFSLCLWSLSISPVSYLQVACRLKSHWHLSFAVALSEPV